MLSERRPFKSKRFCLCGGNHLSWFADRLAAVMSPTGMNVIVKLSSFLLVCIGLQIVWNGVSQLLAPALQAAVPAISH